MTWIELDSLADPRLDPFRDIRSRNWTEHSGYFIAEGPILVEELLASDFACQSLLVTEKFRARFRSYGEDESLDVICLPENQAAELMGFHFHRGVMGCGLRQPLPTLTNLMASADFAIGGSETWTAFQGIHDPENLGGILRSCAALGIRRVVIGPGCADPFSRRGLRVAMGTTLRLDLCRSSNLEQDLEHLSRNFGLRSYAATLSPQATPLHRVLRSGPAILIFGNEKYGLPEETIKKVDHQVRIKMQLGVDSLNVNVAAGIILHHFAEQTDDNGDHEG